MSSSTSDFLEARITPPKIPKIEKRKKHIIFSGLNSPDIDGGKLRVEISESKKKTGSFIINLETSAISDITLEETAQSNVVNTTDSIKFKDLVRNWQELLTLSSSTLIDFQPNNNFNFDDAFQESLKQKGINPKQSYAEDNNTAVASGHQKSTNPKELDSLSSQNILDPSYMKDLFGYVPSKEEIELWNQEDKEFFQLFLQGAEDANLHLEPENLSLSGSSSPAFSQENSIQITSPTPVFQNQELLNQYDSLQKGLSFANQSVFPSLASSATPPIKETTNSDHASHNFYPAGGSVGAMNENFYAISNSGLTGKCIKEELTHTFQDQELLNLDDSLQKTEISFKKQNILIQVQNILIQVQKGLSFANQAVFPSLSSSAPHPIEETTDSDNASHNFYPAGGSVGEMNENFYAISNSGLTDKYTKEEMDTQTIDIISLNNLLGLPQIWG